MINLKIDDNKKNVSENQLEKTKECNQQRKRDFTRVMESLNRLSKSKEV